MSVKILIPIVIFGFSVLFSLSLSHAQTFLGPPTLQSLIGEALAGNLAQKGLMQVRKDLSNTMGIKGYEKALKKYEKKLKKMKKKNDKARKKEEKRLQRLIDDIKSYTPGDPNVNKKQEEKQRKVYEYAQQCQRNDKERAEKLERFSEKNYPRLENFIKTM